MLQQLTNDLNELSALAFRHIPIECLLAVGFGALVGLLRTRLLLATCLAAGALGAWIAIADFDPRQIPPEYILAAVILLALATIEALVVLLGGQAAAGQFWGSVAVVALGLLFIAPLKTLRSAARLLFGDRSIKALLNLFRGRG